MELEDKVVVVTGGASGIGRGLVERFHAEGARHVVVVGGSVTGLGVALALSEQGHRVTVLERDATPLPASRRSAVSWLPLAR